MSEMHIGNFVYKNSNVKYVKSLFADIPKGKGLLVNIGNGGYKIYSDNPKFGYRVYFDKKENMYNCQVFSECALKLKERPLVYQYSKKQDNTTTLDSIITSILYEEGKVRTILNMPIN